LSILFSTRFHSSKTRFLAPTNCPQSIVYYSNLGITGGIYGNLPEDDVANILRGFTPDREAAPVPSVNGDAKAVLEQEKQLLEGLS